MSTLHARRSALTALLPPDVVPPTPDGAFLVRVLREGPEGKHWPQVDGAPMVWDYNEPCNCGMGLARKLWPDAYLHGRFDLACAFGISSEDAGHVFWDLPIYLGWVVWDTRIDALNAAFDAITPTHVADALESARTGASA